jgi:hypothetical protein
MSGTPDDLIPTPRDPLPAPPIHASAKSTADDFRIAIDRLRRDRRRISLRQWCQDTFSWLEGLTSEPVAFYALLAAGVFFTVGGGFALIRFPWSDPDGRMRPLMLTTGILLAALPFGVFGLYRLKAGRSEAKANAGIDAEIKRLRRLRAAALLKEAATRKRAGVKAKVDAEGGSGDSWGGAPPERCYDCGRLISEGRVVRSWAVVGASYFLGAYFAKVSLCPRCAAEQERAEREHLQNENRKRWACVVAGLIVCLAVGAFCVLLPSPLRR